MSEMRKILGFLVVFTVSLMILGCGGEENKQVFHQSGTAVWKTLPPTKHNAPPDADRKPADRAGQIASCLL